MATLSERQPEREPIATAKTATPTARRKPRRRRRLIMLAVFALAVWFLPNVITHTPLFDWALRQAAADLGGTLTVQSASLGWLSPVSVRGIEIKDRKNRPVLSIASVEGDRSLAAILLNYTNLGRFELRDVRASAVLRDDGSNLEDVLAKYLAPKKKDSPPANIAVAVRIVDGSLSVTDQVSGHTWRTDKLSAVFDMLAGPRGPMDASAEISLADAGRTASISGGMKTTDGQSEITLRISEFPLAMVRPLARRFLPELTVAGRLSTQVRLAWTGLTPSDCRAEADLNMDEVTLAMPAVMTTDVLQLDHLHGAAAIALRGDRIDIEKASINCDLGDVIISGTVPVGGKDGFSLAAVARRRQELKAGVDLARLARALPATLHLRQNMRIDSGQVQLALASTPGPQGVVWHGQMDATNLSATAGGERLAWQQPIKMVLDAHEAPGGPVIDALRCDSDFLRIEAAGTSDDASAQISLSLKRLGDQLGQFVDLGGVQLAGEGSGGLRWKHAPQGQFNADGQLRISGYQWSMPRRAAWREDSVEIALAASGRTDFAANTHIDAASLGVKSGGDQFDVRLAEPIADFWAARPWSVHARAQGSLQNWPARLAAWLPAGNWRIAGTYALEADARPLGGGPTHCDARMEVKDLVFLDAAGRRIQEPVVRLSATGDYDSASGTAQLSQVQMTSSVLAAGAAGRVVPGGGGAEAQLGGQINYDVGRLVDLLRPYVGAGFSAAGRGSSSAWFRGPLSLSGGEGEASIRWDRANLGGLPLGPGEMKAAMARGVVQIAPLDVALNQGRVHLAPRIRLSPDPIELSLPAGWLAERIQVDPAACASMLQYAAPALASATAARGTVSVYLDACRIVPADLAKSDISGRIVVHAMEIGSGAMTHELSALLDRDAPAKLRPESVVAFRMQNGRIYHEGMELVFPDISIRTSGWVGLDKTLEITAELPVPRKWLAGSAAAVRAVGNQTIRLPLRGWLDRPQLDRQAMEQASAQFVKKAAGNIIQNGVGDGINKLFGPKR